MKDKLRSLTSQVRELARELGSSPECPSFTAPQHVYLFLADLAVEEREHFVVLFLDARNRLIGERYTVSIGTLSASLVHPREVFREAITRGAASMIVAHNHPSGDPTPSIDDQTLTSRLEKAGELIGIEVLDHLVLGAGTYTAWKQNWKVKKMYRRKSASTRRLDS